MSSMPKKSSTSNARRSGAVSGSMGGTPAVMVDGFQTWMAVNRECQREMMDFVSRRLAKDSDTMREILATRSLADAAAAQSRWVEQTFRDYSTQMTRLMAICTKAGMTRSENP